MGVHARNQKGKSPVIESTVTWPLFRPTPAESSSPMRGVNAVSVHWLWADATGKEALAVESPWRQEQEQEPVEGEYLRLVCLVFDLDAAKMRYWWCLITRVSRRVLFNEGCQSIISCFICSKVQQRQCMFRWVSLLTSYKTFLVRSIKTVQDFQSPYQINAHKICREAAHRHRLQGTAVKEGWGGGWKCNASTATPMHLVNQRPPTNRIATSLCHISVVNANELPDEYL